MRKQTTRQFLASLVTLAALATTALAGSVSVNGDLDNAINFRRGGGGEFRMNFVDGDTGPDLAPRPDTVHDFGGYLDGGFQSFCVEFDEGIRVGRTYDYTVDSFIQHRTGPRDLAFGTAYLFTEFWEGTLTPYEYDASKTSSGNREDTSRALQLAIWKLQGFNPSSYGSNSLATSFVQQANAAVADASVWGQTIGDVRVLNLFKDKWSGPKQFQSQLILTATVVPLPPAANLGFLLLGGIGFVRWRRRRHIAG